MTGSHGNEYMNETDRSSPEAAMGTLPKPDGGPVAALPEGDARQRHRVLEALLEISNLLGSNLELDEILAKIVRIATGVMETQNSSIYLWNDDRSRLVMRSNVGFEPELIGKAGFDKGRGIPGWVAEEGKIVALADAAKDPRYDPLPTTLDYDFRAYLCAPLVVQDEVVGVMTVRRNVVQEFTADEITIYETICKQIANVIEKSRMHAARVEAEKLAAVAVSLSGIAHYIKNILTTIRGGAYLVDTGLKREQLDKTRQGWKILKSSIQKISELVENMLNYYRDRTLHPRPVELNTLILEILESLEDRAIERRTVITPDLDLRLGEVELDVDVIQDIMINLVTNAFDAIPEGAEGIVRVQTRLTDDGRHVRIAVIDNGTGIAPEDCDKVFNLFYTTKGEHGTGIGLSATRKLIIDHGGNIEFETHVGSGTEFTIHLPITQSET